MSTNGETADLMVREGIQITESALKLAGLGAKNLAALLIALANDNQKLAGKTNLKRLIHDGEELTIFSVKQEDLKGFQVEAKRYGVLFYPIVNKVEKTGTVEIMAKARDAKQINRIFERMGYPAPVKEDTAAKKENARAPSENSSKERGTGARASTEPATVREIKAPANYSINPTVMTAYLEFNGQIVTFEVQNTSVSTGVSIKKTGPVQAVPGQPIRYVFSQIKNSSNVALDSFYWRDQLPAQVMLSKIVTGSYNQPLSYKVVYKTNLSGDYRTLADNLSTSKVYVLDARPAVLGLAANERVTEVMFVFGNVKAGFAQVETPYIYATARSGLANNASVVNVADVGGLYNGQWIQAVSRWLTTVYTKTTVRLPKTGY